MASAGRWETKALQERGPPGPRRHICEDVSEGSCLLWLWMCVRKVTLHMERSKILQKQEPELEHVEGLD